ncbi:MAG: hypothetical protein WCP10_04915, partial [Desulfuromonadales bacterium]
MQSASVGTTVLQPAAVGFFMQSVGDCGTAVHPAAFGSVTHGSVTVGCWIPPDKVTETLSALTAIDEVPPGGMLVVANLLL